MNKEELVSTEDAKNLVIEGFALLTAQHALSLCKTFGIPNYFTASILDQEANENYTITFSRDNYAKTTAESENIAFAEWCSKYYSTDDSKIWHPAYDISEDFNLEFTTAELLDKFRKENANTQHLAPNP